MVLDRIQAADYAGDDKDVQIVSELLDDLQDAVTDYQVREDLTIPTALSFRQPV